MTQAKNILFTCLLAVLFVPLMAGFVFKLTERPLEGVNNDPKKPELAINNYIEGKLREQTDEYLKLKMGFRATLVRSFNELDYRLLNHTNAPGVELGRNNILYLRSYIDEYTGENLQPDSTISNRVENLKTISDTLEANGKKLLIVFAPGKACYYPEYLPEKFTEKNTQATNYNAYKNKFAQYSLNFIDLNSYYSNQLKAKTPYPLYPETGVHWTGYGSLTALDTICKWINDNTAFSCPLLEYTLTMSKDLKDEDYDVGKLMNILTTLPHSAMPYASITGLKGDSAHKPTVLIISDSYWWTLVSKQYPQMVFTNNKFIFYNKEIYINNVKQETSVLTMDMQAEIMKYDVVMIISTEATYAMFPYFFDEDAITSQREKIDRKKKEIKASTEWMAGIKERATENKITIEEMIEKEAKWAVEHRR